MFKINFIICLKLKHKNILYNYFIIKMEIIEFIEIYENVLSSELCDEIIDKFDNFIPNLRFAVNQ